VEGREGRAREGKVRGGDVLLRRGEGEGIGESCFLALRGMDAPDSVKMLTSKNASYKIVAVANEVMMTNGFTLAEESYCMLKLSILLVSPRQL